MADGSSFILEIASAQGGGGKVLESWGNFSQQSQKQGFWSGVGVN